MGRKFFKLAAFGICVALIGNVDSAHADQVPIPFTDGPEDVNAQIEAYDGWILPETELGPDSPYGLKSEKPYGQEVWPDLSDLPKSTYVSPVDHLLARIRDFDGATRDLAAKAEKGDPAAMLDLADLAFAHGVDRKGKAVDKARLAQAAKLYAPLAAQRYPSAILRLRQLKDLGVAVNGDVEGWYEDIDPNDPRLVGLAERYNGKTAYPEIVDPEIVDGFTDIIKASERGETLAHFTLMLRRKHYPEAKQGTWLHLVRSLERAADDGSIPAQFAWATLIVSEPKRTGFMFVSSLREQGVALLETLSKHADKTVAARAHLYLAYAKENDLDRSIRWDKRRNDAAFYHLDRAWKLGSIRAQSVIAAFGVEKEKFQDFFVDPKWDDYMDQMSYIAAHDNLRDAALKGDWNAQIQFAGLYFQEDPMLKGRIQVGPLRPEFKEHDVAWTVLEQGAERPEPLLKTALAIRLMQRPEIADLTKIERLHTEAVFLEPFVAFRSAHWLAHAYWTGDGVRKDNLKAYLWLSFLRHTNVAKLSTEWFRQVRETLSADDKAVAEQAFRYLFVYVRANANDPALWGHVAQYLPFVSTPPYFAAPKEEYRVQIY